MKALKRLLASFMVAVMVLTAAPLSGFVGLELPDLGAIFSTKAEAATYSGTCGENLTWTLDKETGELVIDGTGAMKGYRPDKIYGTLKTPWYNYISYIETVIIGDNVTNIGACAFWNCRNLVSVTVGKSITSIGYKAFYCCNSLENIVIPSSVTTIGDYAFYGCNSLASIEIPNNVTTIGAYAFLGCNSLASIEIPNNVTTIGNYAFQDCYSLEDIEIPDSVTTIGEHAFENCTSLDSIEIPDSVTTIGDYAFYCCDSLTTITVDEKNQYYKSDEYGVLFSKDKTILIQYPVGNKRTSYIIPDSVTGINDRAFSGCNSLTSITIPNSVTTIGYAAFKGCISLMSITIPNSVISIDDWAFSDCDSLMRVIISNSVSIIEYCTFNDCDSLESITIPDSVTHIGEHAFLYCTSLTDVCYEGTEEQWDSIIIADGNDCLTSATIHYNYNPDDSDTPDGDEDENEYDFYLSKELVFLEKNEYFKFSAFLEDGTDVTDFLDWKSYDEDVAEFVSPGLLLAKENGDALILVSTPISNEYYEYAYCDVYVGDPNYIEYNTVYDEEYYYNGDGFYSNSAQISNAVDIYLSLKNCVAYEIYDHYNDYISQNKYEEEFSSMEIGEFTVTATVSGNDLSFSKDNYSNTYIGTFDNIPLETIVDDMLILYPYGLTVSGDKKLYTVSIKIESDDFETIEDTITFSISDLASKAANEHIDYLNTNVPYKNSLNNYYGTNMVQLKYDKEYNFSKYSTFDFDNYHEIVVGDMLIDILNVHQTGHISLLPTVVTEYNNVIDTVISNINTIVYEDYVEDKLNISKNDIDEFIKISKYRDDGIYAENVIFQTIQKVCGNVGNAEKINKAFAAADKTGHICKYLDFGLDTINNIVDFANRISVFNAYKDASNSFKEVFEKLCSFIPASEYKMREALQDYINYADNGFTMTAEIVEAYADFSKQVGIDALTTFFGKSFIELTSASICKWIGTISIKGGTATIASTAGFATVQTALGGVLTGAAVGLCLTDLFCSSGKKAAEMSKIVAMSEYSPYIVEMVKYYENNLNTNKNNYSVELFENAFAIHKVSQVYITEHTIKALEIKRDSLVERLFNREGEYEQIITGTLSAKSQFESMTCHSNDDTVVFPTRKTKVIAVKCPVDVLVYDEYGNIVVEIRNNILNYCADEIEVCISNSKKYICVPAENEYEVKIVSIGEGTMDYIVFEYDENVNLQHKKVIENIPISTGDEFKGIIEVDENDSQDSVYSLSGDSDEYYTKEDVCIRESHIKSVINYTTPSCTNSGYSGDIYCETCQKIIEYGERLESLGHNYQNGCCSICGESDPYYYHGSEFSLNLINETANTVTLSAEINPHNVAVGAILIQVMPISTRIGKCTGIDAKMSVFELSNGNTDNGVVIAASSDGVNDQGIIVYYTFTKLSDEPVCCDDFNLVVKECFNTKSEALVYTVVNNLPSPHKHSFVTSVTAPTSTEQGYTTYTCTGCGYSYKDNFVATLGTVHSVSIDNISLDYKSSTTITPSINADSGVKYTVTYSSSNPSVASVDANGKVTTRDTGSATITVTVTDDYGNAVSDTCNVEVKYNWWQWIIVIVLFGWIWY